jgi:hypothetical protein
MEKLRGGPLRYFCRTQKKPAGELRALLEE